MDFVKQLIILSQKEIEPEKKTIKNDVEQNTANNIRLNIDLQAMSAAPLPKAVNPSFTLISQE